MIESPLLKLRVWQPAAVHRNALLQLANQALRGK